MGMVTVTVTVMAMGVIMVISVYLMILEEDIVSGQ